jgi:hypothetical protein
VGVSTNVAESSTVLTTPTRTSTTSTVAGRKTSEKTASQKIDGSAAIRPKIDFLNTLLKQNMTTKMKSTRKRRKKRTMTRRTW